MDFEESLLFSEKATKNTRHRAGVVRTVWRRLGRGWGLWLIVGLVVHALAQHNTTATFLLPECGGGVIML